MSECVDCLLLRTDEGKHYCALTAKIIHDICENGCSKFVPTFEAECRGDVEVIEQFKLL